MHAPKLSKMRYGNDAPMAAVTSLISGCDTFWEKARISANCHEHSIECEQYAFSNNQSKTGEEVIMNT
jgi:hypothetical protein